MDVYNAISLSATILVEYSIGSYLRASVIYSVSSVSLALAITIVWNKTKDTITKKGIPFVLDAVKEIATAITTAMIQSAITGL